MKRFSFADFEPVKPVHVREHYRRKPKPKEEPRCAADDWEFTSIRTLKDDYPEHVVLGHFMRVGTPKKPIDLYWARKTPDSPLVLAIGA